MGKWPLGVLALITLLGMSCWPSSCEKPEPPLPPPPPPPPVTELDVGLSAAESLVWRRTPEGSDLVPVDLLRALKDAETGRLYIDSLEDYGFLPSPASEANPYGLPVGWTVNVPSYSVLGLDFVGVNCAACHTGQIETSEVSLRIDGAPNMADIEALALSAKSSAKALLENPVELVLFVARLLTLEPPEGTSGRSLGSHLSESARATLKKYAKALENDTDEPEDVAARALGEALGRALQGDAATTRGDEVNQLVRAFERFQEIRDDIQKILDLLRDLRALLENRLQLAYRALHALEISELPGPGRDDPWGLIRNVLFASGTELTAPTSIPALYYGGQFGWYHADGNTNSVMQRDIAQAVALGGFVDPKTGQSSLLPRAIWQLEDMMRKLKSPAWPSDVFGPIDTAKASRGEELFSQHCQSCHHAHEGDLISLEAVGTDPNRAKNFLKPQDGLPFHEAIAQEVSLLETTVLEQAGISPEEAASHEYNGPPVWRGTGKYQSRLLSGIWSTAPYLHNGSVPTLFDLLLPVDQRPTSFQVGNRLYDPEKVGYVTEVDDPPFTFQSSSIGGSNAGHEYGTELGDEDRWALVEYLKGL